MARPPLESDEDPQFRICIIGDTLGDGPGGALGASESALAALGHEGAESAETIVAVANQLLGGALEELAEGLGQGRVDELGGDARILMRPPCRLLHHAIDDLE